MPHRLARKALVVPVAVIALVLAPHVAAQAKKYTGTEQADTLKGKGTNDVFKACLLYTSDAADE